MAADVQHSGQQRETRSERINRELIELLNELRVALPGVQFLFAFLLVVPFQQRGGQTTDFQKDVYFVTLVAAAVATGLLIARPPSTGCCSGSTTRNGCCGAAVTPPTPGWSCSRSRS